MHFDWITKTDVNSSVFSKYNGEKMYREFFLDAEGSRYTGCYNKKIVTSSTRTDILHLNYSKCTTGFS